MNHQVTIQELRKSELSHSFLLAAQSGKKKLFWQPRKEQYTLYRYNNGTWMVSYFHMLDRAVEKYNDI